jgi:hypothetical protein
VGVGRILRLNPFRAIGTRSATALSQKGKLPCHTAPTPKLSETVHG